MGKNGYCPVYSCKKGEEYFIRTISDSGMMEYKRIEFRNYRPHPGEITVKDGEKVRLAYRADLFQRSGKPD